jgi:hypothetical protein
MTSQPTDESTLTAQVTGGLCELRILHPPGTFALTPASLISLRTIGEHRQLLAGHGIDWGSGTGCLAIAAAKIAAVESVIGLEITESNVAIARENAERNGVSDKITVLRSDAYSPFSSSDRAMLDSFRHGIDFILANPPSSEGDDGFGFRRVVLRGAAGYLVPGGVVFLSVSFQYGQSRVERLCHYAPGFTYGGVLASTEWVAFDLGRPDLLHCLHLYSQEERRGGSEYTFRHPEDPNESMSAEAAMAYYQETGKSPLSKWQTHLFVFGRR